MTDLTISQDEDGYWLLNEYSEQIAGPFATLQDAEDVRENPPPPPMDEEPFYDGPSFRDQYVAAWHVKQSLRS